MGGIGSGRWHGHRKRPLVEDSLVLDAVLLAQVSSALLWVGRVSRAGVWETRQQIQAGNRPRCPLGDGTLRLLRRRTLTKMVSAAGSGVEAIAPPGATVGACRPDPRDASG